MFDLIPFRRKNAISSLFDEFERGFWPEFFRDSFFEGGMNTFKADIRDNGSEYLLEAELPGFDKEQIQIEVNGDVLTISTGKEEMVEEENAGTNYIRKERRVGKVARSFALDNVKVDGISADFKDGVLKMVLPKLKETAGTRRRIDIH